MSAGRGLAIPARRIGGEEALGRVIDPFHANLPMLFPDGILGMAKPRYDQRWRAFATCRAALWRFNLPTTCHSGDVTGMEGDPVQSRCNVVGPRGVA